VFIKNICAATSRAHPLTLKASSRTVHSTAPLIAGGGRPSSAPPLSRQQSSASSLVGKGRAGLILINTQCHGRPYDLFRSKALRRAGGGSAPAAHCSRRGGGGLCPCSLKSCAALKIAGHAVSTSDAKECGSSRPMQARRRSRAAHCIFSQQHCLFRCSPAFSGVAGPRWRVLLRYIY
jgi:hypothetical protein